MTAALEERVPRLEAMFAAVGLMVGLVTANLFPGLNAINMKLCVLVGGGVVGALGGRALRGCRLKGKSYSQLLQVVAAFLFVWLVAGACIGAACEYYGWLLLEDIWWPPESRLFAYLGVSALAGMSSAALSLPFFGWLWWRAEAALRARPGSLMAQSHERALGRAFVSCIVALAIAGMLLQPGAAFVAYPMDPFESVVVFLLVLLVCVLYLVQLYVNALDGNEALRRIEDDAHELESLEGVRNPSAAASEPGVIDVGIGKEVHGHHAGANRYREASNGVPVVIGFVERAAFHLDRERRIAAWWLTTHGAAALLCLLAVLG